MFEKIIQFLLAIGLLKGTFERNLDMKIMNDIEDILRSVDQENIDDPNDVPNLHERKHRGINRNLDDDNGDARIDIDSLNEFIQRIANNNDNNQFNDDDFNRFLRTTNENLCRKIGRCGCGKAGARCGNNNLSDNETLHDIQRLLDDLDDREERDNDRDIGDRDINRYDIDYIKHHVNVPLSNNNDNDVEYGNRIDHRVNSADNRLDLIMVNDLSDLENLFKKNGLSEMDGLDNLNEQDFGDSIHRNGRIKNNRNNFEAIVVDLSKFYNDSGLSGGNADVQRSDDDSIESSNPEEFLQQFRTLKEKVVNNFVSFIMHGNAKRPNLSALSNTQKRKLRILKGRMRTNKDNLTPQQIKREVTDILFGRYSVVKFVPSEENANKIVVPKWVYKLITSTQPLPLRTPKILLPLTQKQKQRLYNMKLNHSQKPAISKVWRRNLGQNLQRYGVPFELAVQGLAQYNDQ